MPTIKPNQAKEIIDKVFKDSEAVYRLKEFGEINFGEALDIREEERGRFYIKDLKSGNSRLVFDEEKQIGKPEEIVRQLWLHKLHTAYRYPFDRMDTEKSVHFGREIHKKDKITPYIILAIVLPQGVLNNTNMEYIREFLFEKARILAVVGLHVNTFKPHTGTKTSVLFLQKWGSEAGEPLRDYPIFMAVSKKPGKDNSGEYVYKKDANGNFIHDNK